MHACEKVSGTDCVNLCFPYTIQSRKDTLFLVTFNNFMHHSVSLACAWSVFFTLYQHVAVSFRANNTMTASI